MINWTKILLVLGVVMVVWGTINTIIIYGNWVDVIDYYSGTDVEELMFSLGHSSLINSIIIIVIGMVMAIASILRIKKSKLLKKGK